MLLSGMRTRQGFHCLTINAPSFSAENPSEEQHSAASFAAKESNLYSNDMLGDRHTSEQELPENLTPTLPKRQESNSLDLD